MITIKSTHLYILCPSPNINVRRQIYLCDDLETWNCLKRLSNFERLVPSHCRR